MDPNPSLAGSEPLWDARAVAAYLNISRSSVYNFVDQELIPVVRVGALLRFRPEDVRNFGRTSRLPAVAPLKR